MAENRVAMPLTPQFTPVTALKRRRHLVAAALVLLVGVSPMQVAAFDASEYRQNTYGPPTHYCDPARPLSDNGVGTLASPWNMSQCATQPVAGNVVGVLPGVSVRLPTTSNDNVPAFRPSNAGTAQRRIVYVTKHAAVALPNVATNPNRTELRHDGSAPRIVNGVGAGNGCAMYGSNGRDYITFDGFFVDMAQAYMAEDSGVIRSENARGVHFRNFVVKGTNLTVASNAVIYRPHNAVDTVLSNFRAYDFSNDGSGSQTPQPALFSDQYGDQNVLIEHFEISNISRGIYFKGTTPGPTFNYGTIRYGIVSNVSTCFQFNDLHATQMTTLEYNICHSVIGGTGIRISSETTAARNLLIRNNTVARVDASSMNSHGAMYSRANGIGSNVIIRDNLFVLDSGRFGHGADFGEVSGLPSVMNFNGYWKGGSTLTWSHNGVEYSGINAFRSGTGRETNGIVLTSNPFVDSANNNFRIVSGHIARTASSTGGELGAYAAGVVIGVDVDANGASAPLPPSGLRAE